MKPTRYIRFTSNGMRFRFTVPDGMEPEHFLKQLQSLAREKLGPLCNRPPYSD